MYAMAAMATFLTAIEAAQLAGVSPKTIRRWLQSGRLTAVKRGRSFRIPADQIAAMANDIGQAERPSVDSGHQTNGTLSSVAADGHSDSGHAALVALVAELIPKAEAAAMWQARAELLAGELAASRDRVRALEALTSGVRDVAPGGEPGTPDGPREAEQLLSTEPWFSTEVDSTDVAGAGQVGPAEPRGRPWWQRLLWG